MSTAYLYLAAAIIFEVIGTISMKYSEGFTKVVPVIITVICHGICFVALAVALKSLPIGMVYAVWAGVGTALMALLGMMFFNEPMVFHRVAATVLIVLGVVLLNVSPKSSESLENSEHQVARILEDSKVVLPLEAAPVKTEHKRPIALAERNSG